MHIEKNNKIPTEYGLELKSITKNASMGALGILFMTVMAFVNNIVITRKLGADSYGLWVLATNIFYFIVIIPQLGFSSTIIRYVSYYTGKGEHAKAKGTILFALKILLVFSIIILFISLLINPLISEHLFKRPELLPLLRILLLSIPFVVIARVFYSALNGLKLIKYQVIAANILHPLILFFLIIIVFFAGYKLTGLIWIMFVMGAFSAVMSYYFLYKKYFKYKRKLKPEVEKKELFLFAIPIYLNQFLNFAIKFVPIFIIGYFLSNEDVGIFNVGFKIALLVSISLEPFRLIFSPTISSLFAKSNIKLINQLYKTITKWIFIVALITFSIIILFAEPILNIFGKEFIAGINVLLLLVFGELINATVGLSGDIIIMSGRPKVELLNSVINIFVIVTLCLLLIPDYGIVGAAFSYAITIGLISIIRIIELYYFEKIHPYKLSYFKPLIVGAISFTLIYFVKNSIDLNYYIEIIFGILIYLLLFGLLLWAFKFDKEDKFVLGLILNKLNRNNTGV